ncbi:ceramidase domain-containing protein [Thalassobellus sediminis]|uniref:ceramidase domain-containing protein n=1 Tax=Thalassobellus sediminis TaxID=3367753 RepID=UPI0037B97E50
MERIGYKVLIVIGVLSLIMISLIPPIAQSHNYHNFSDGNTLFKISNFWNVISNIPFVIIGFLGLYKLKGIKKENLQYASFFTGVILVGFGSGYYHLNPNDVTLVWDRLPMTIVFMSLVSIIISEFISCKKGRYLLFPMLVLGILSIVYWIVFNDLRPYVIIQFYPMLAIPIILIFFKSMYNKTFGYWLLLFAYIIAKFFEYFDSEIFTFLGVLSGHSLKHIISVFGIFVLHYMYIKRQKLIE